jgi:hypothetical protein
MRGFELYRQGLFIIDAAKSFNDWDRSVISLDREGLGCETMPDISTRAPSERLCGG